MIYIIKQTPHTDMKNYDEENRLFGYTTYNKSDSIDFQTIREVLDISKSTLYDKLKLYKIKPIWVYKGQYIYDRELIESVLFYNEIVLEGMKAISLNKETIQPDYKKK